MELWSGEANQTQILENVQWKVDPYISPLGPIKISICPPRCSTREEMTQVAARQKQNCDSLFLQEIGFQNRTRSTYNYYKNVERYNGAASTAMLGKSEARSAARAKPHRRLFRPNVGDQGVKLCCHLRCVAPCTVHMPQQIEQKPRPPPLLQLVNAMTTAVGLL